MICVDLVLRRLIFCVSLGWREDMEKKIRFHTFEATHTMCARYARNMNVEERKRGKRERRRWKDDDEFNHIHVDVRFWCGVFRERAASEKTVQGLFVAARSTTMCVK